MKYLDAKTKWHLQMIILSAIQRDEKTQSKMVIHWHKTFTVYMSLFRVLRKMYNLNVHIIIQIIRYVNSVNRLTANSILPLNFIGGLEAERAKFQVSVNTAVSK
jgi:hypothetical protein